MVVTKPGSRLTRRAMLTALMGSVVTLYAPYAARADIPFEQWVTAFRSKALARGISDETYARVMRGVQPDMTGLTAIQNQPEINQQLWQYLNRAASDWRIAAGKAKAKEYAALLSRIERDFGVEPSFMLGVWGIESAFGDPIVEKNHMRPVIPSLATLAWAEPRRRSYWESEFINALAIVQRGWSTPEDMVGSCIWASTTMATERSPLTARPTMRSPPRRVTSLSAAVTAAASVGAMRCACGDPSAARLRAATPPGMRSELFAPTASPTRSRMPRRAPGCRSPAAQLSCSDPIFSPRAAITPP